MSNRIRRSILAITLVGLTSGFTSYGMHRYPTEDYPIKLTNYEDKRSSSSKEGEKKSSTSDFIINQSHFSESKPSYSDSFVYDFKYSSYRNYFSSDTNPNQRSKNKSKFEQMDLLNETYNFSELMQRKVLHSDDIACAFENQFQKFANNPFVTVNTKKRKTADKKYNCDQSNILKLNLVNYFFALDGRLSKNYKTPEQANKNLNVIPWDNKYYSFLVNSLDNTNVPKDIYDVVEGIIKLDIENKLINQNEISRISSKKNAKKFSLFNLFNK